MGTLDPGDIISLIMLCICVLTLSLNTWHTSKKDTETDSERITKISTQLDNITCMLTEVKLDLSSMKTEMKADHDLLIKTTQSVKSAWHEINNIRGFGSKENDEGEKGNG